MYKRLVLLALIILGSSFLNFNASATDVWVYSKQFHNQQINYYVDTNYIGGFKTADIFAIVKVVYPQYFTCERYSFGFDAGDWYYACFDGNHYTKGKVSDSQEVSKVLQVVLDKQHHKY